MDEIALMVRQIVAYPSEKEGAEDEQAHGFLRVSRVGGVDLRHLYGQQIVVHGQRNLPGVIAALPTHMLPPDRGDRPYDLDELVADVGLPLGECVSWCRLAILFSPAAAPPAQQPCQRQCWITAPQSPL